MNSIEEFTASFDAETKWHANHNGNSEQHLCRAGNLNMIYERGSIRHISIGGIEIVRMIYSAVRDREWITIDPVIADETIEINPDSFKIKYKAVYRTDKIDFQAHYTISGSPDNSLTFSFAGEAFNDFEKNRIGFCVLHPIESNMGENCTIIHSNNAIEELQFPFYISPRQPFLDLKSMRWKRSELNCSLDFFGDIFETEDQRNWTDASYKTYCTPLGNPRPARVTKGQKISQKIVFKAYGGEKNVSGNSDVISISIDRKELVPIPMIGVGQSTRNIPVTRNETEIIKKIEFDHYRADIYLFDENWKAKIELAFREAALLGSKLELALFVDDDYMDQIRSLVKFAELGINNLSVIILYHKVALATPDLLVEHSAPFLKKAFPGVNICCGTNANFVQLNRKRPQTLQSDEICYSIHPQEHASDNLTLIENLQAQAYTIESALQFSNSRKIRVSPVNIQRRFNANVSNFEKFSDGYVVPPQVDSRLMSIFGACWIAGSLKYLIESGASAITVLETVGERGIIQGDYDSRWPEDFQSVKGMIFPVYSVLKYILSNKKSNVVVSRSSHPLKVDSLVFCKGESLKIMLLNFTSEFQKVRIESGAKESSIRILSAETYASVVSDEDWLEKVVPKKIKAIEPLLIEPFSVTFVEG
jgi:hypothetical protein